MLHFLRSARDSVPYTAWSVDSLCELCLKDILKNLTLGFEMYVTGCNLPRNSLRPTITYFRKIGYFIDAHHSQNGVSGLLHNEVSDPLRNESPNLAQYPWMNTDIYPWNYSRNPYSVITETSAPDCNDSRPRWVMSYDLSSDTSDPLSFRRRIS